MFDRVEKLHVKLMRDNGGKRNKNKNKKKNNGNDDDDDTPETLSGLDELYMQDVDAETLWGQVELQNDALKGVVKKSIRKLRKAVNNKKEPIRLLDMEEISDGGESNDEDDTDEDEEKEGESDDDDDGDDDSEEDDNDDINDDEGDDEATRRMKERMRRAMADMENDQDDDDEEEDEFDGFNGGKKRPAAESDKSKKEKDDDAVDPAREGMMDGFFDLHEMEAFADEEEDYLPEDAFGEAKPEEQKDDDDDGEPKKKSFHQRQRDGEFDSGSDDDELEDDDDDKDDDDEVGGLDFSQPLIRRAKYRPDDEVDALFTLYQTPKDDDDDDSVVNMTAADMFGMPDKKVLQKWKTRSKRAPSSSMVQASKNVDDMEADSWDEASFGENGKGWQHGDDNDNGKDDQDNANESDSDDDGDEEDENEDDEKDDTNDQQDRKPAATNKLQRQTEELQEELLAEKPWQMRGETKGSARPTNSLLEATPEFEVATKRAPIVTAEHTESIEEVIKRRILDEDWDDVVPRELPDIGWNAKRGELPEVSQEKSKLGLGELYEREYLKKAAGYDADAAEKKSTEDRAKDEMKALFAGLCSKLDALSNYHFAPRPVAAEAEVREVTTPAIAMEETVPLHVSTARGVAPQEVYKADAGRGDVLRGETELEQDDRKRLRNAKKAARRKARQQKKADERLLSRLHPGLGLNNPYEKRKAREELAMARSRSRFTEGQADSNNDYGASSKFFRRLQEEAERTVHGGDDGGDGDGERPSKRSKHSGRSGAVKL